MDKGIVEIAKKAKEASFKIANLTTEKKNSALKKIADFLDKKRDYIKEKNKIDIENAKKNNLSSAMIDRLTLSDKVIDSMIQGVLDIIALPDPVGEVVKMWKRPNGMVVGKKRIPLGVICMIFESRPNVVVDASSLCLKSGNAAVLRGGKEAYYSNKVLCEIIQNALESEDIPKEAVQVFPTTDREAVKEILKLDQYIDLVIPRGKEGLIRTVVENSTIPVIKHYKGVCHIFVDKDYGNYEFASKIVINSKAQRPGVCNALETLLIDKDIAEDFLPKIVDDFKKAGVKVKGCEICQKILPEIEPATEEDWDTEYLDYIISIKVVDGIEGAISHIQKYGSNHTDGIITQNYKKAMDFVDRVDSSAVLINASTRLNDGGVFGLGAEIGISTTKLHAYGPMGLEELTTTKFIVFGQGQIRE